MKLMHHSVTNFRNYQSISLELSEGLNLFFGDNGQGKTNFLESIYYALTAFPLRNVKEKELVNWQASPLRLKTMFKREESDRLHELKFATDGAKHFLSLNGVNYKKHQDLPLRLDVIAFTPDDVLIVKGSPEKRRHYLDQEMSLLVGGYYLYRKNYYKVLRQRNEVLKAIFRGQEAHNALLPWNRQLAEYGAKLIFSRLEFLKKLVPMARKVHEYLTKDKKYFNITYQSSFGQVENDDENALMERYHAFFQKYEKEELRRGTSLYGAHRDDLIFYENGIDLRTFGSQGQQRTAILALKIALVSYIEVYLKERPILLLDDVLSELDPYRRQKLLTIIAKKDIQSFITGASLDFKLNYKLAMRQFNVKEGKIIPYL
jgi:DNA replication and repair protein recF